MILTKFVKISNFKIQMIFKTIFKAFDSSKTLLSVLTENICKKNRRRQLFKNTLPITTRKTCWLLKLVITDFSICSIGDFVVFFRIAQIVSTAHNRVAGFDIFI